MNAICSILLTTFLVSSPPVAILVADRETVDAGVVRSGPLLRQVYRVTNPSATLPLQIVGLDGTCGCIRKSFAKSDLKPGETTDVTVEINTLTQPEGPNTWKTNVRYRVGSATMEERITLELVAKIVKELEVKPPMLAISSEGAAKSTIVLMDRRATPLTVKAITSTSTYLTANVREAKEGTISIEVSIAEGVATGSHDETILITTSDPLYPELRVPVRIIKRSKDAVLALPESLDLHIATESVTASGVVQFRRPNAANIQIATATCTGKGVSLKWSAGSGAVATIRATIDLRTAGASGQTTIRVTFNESTSEEVIVPLAWVTD